MLSRQDVGTFISELGRRRVFRVAAWYMAVGWAIIQGSATVFPIIDVSEAAQRVVLYGVIAMAPVAFVLAWYFDITPRGVQRTESREQALWQTRVAERLGRSIVVLPFVDLSGGTEAAYFADGVTEDIIAALSGVRDVRVISRTSSMQYRGSDKPLPQIAAELGVAHVLEGSVRRAGDRVRIVAQLVDARSDEHMWGETYDRELSDIFAIQSSVAEHIVEALKVELSGAERRRLTRQPTQHIEAYDAYLRGRHLWNQRTERSMRDGIVLLRDALEADPDFALAWAALAEAYVTLGFYGVAAPGDVMPQARDAAQRALVVAPDRAEALTPLAAVRLHYDWDWAGAEADYQRATENDPKYPTAWHWYANQLAAAMRFDEARVALERARELDPVSPAILTSAGIISYFERDFERATGELAAVVARYPSFPLAHMFDGMVRLAMQRHDEALQLLQRAVMTSGGSPEARACQACALAASGFDGEARTLLRGLDSGSYVSPVLQAYVLASLGELDAALDRLEAATAVRAADLVWIGVRPFADPLRPLARFQELVRPVLDTRAGAFA